MDNKPLSAATKRAYNYPNKGNEWLCSFQYTEVQGLGYEEGVHRRDPSSIIKVDDKYYVWYTKSIGMFYSAQDIHEGTHFKLYPWDQADIFYATSTDGINWEEQGPAIRRGKKGDYDDRTVCTPEILCHENKYYLVYQSVCDPYNGYNEKVGMSVAESPDGPWTKTKKQILAPKENGKWFGDTDTYNTGFYYGSVHDPLLIPFNNQFYLYYKCCCYHNGETILFALILIQGIHTVIHQNMPRVIHTNLDKESEGLSPTCSNLNLVLGTFYILKTSKEANCKYKQLASFNCQIVLLEKYFDIKNSDNIELR